MAIPQVRVLLGFFLNCLVGSLMLISAHAAQPDIGWMRGGHGYNTYQVEPLAGGLTAASIGGDGMLKLTRISDGMLLHSVGVFSQRAYSLAVSRDGALIAVGGVDWVTYGGASSTAIKLFRASDLNLVRTIPLDGVCNAPGQLAFSPDGSLLVSAGDNGQRCGGLWRVSDGSLVSDLSYSIGTTIYRNLGANMAAFSPDGQYIATTTTGDYSSLVLYRVADGTVFTFGPRTGWGQAVEFSPNGASLVTTAGDGVRVYATGDACPLTSSGCRWTGNSPDDVAPVLMRASGFQAFAPRFSPDGNLLAVGGNHSASTDFPDYAPFVKLWVVAGWTPSRAFATGDSYDSYPPAPAFLTDGQSLITAGKSVRQWRVADGSLVRAWVPNTTLTAIAFSQDGQILASGDDNNTGVPYSNSVRLWRVSDGALLQSLAHQDLSIPCYMRAAFSRDGSTVATSCAFNGEGNVKLWRVSDGALLNTIPAGRITSLAFSPDGQQLALGYGNGGLMEVRAVSDGTLLKSFNTYDHSTRISAIAASPDGQQWAAAHSGGVTVFRADTSYGTELGGNIIDASTFGGHGIAVTFSADGTAVYAAGTTYYSGGVPKVIGWRLSDGSVLLDAPLVVSSADATRARAIRSVSFSPDLRFIAASGDDAAIRFWRLSDGAQVALIDQETGSALHAGTGHSSSMIQAGAFSPDGRKFAYGRGDGVIVMAADPISNLLQYDQTIAFGAAPALTVNGTATVIATASSGLPVALSSATPSVCSMSGSTVTALSSGACVIAANQPGNANYNPAPQVTQSITVSAANQTIVFGLAPTLTMNGTATVSATASSSLPVTFSTLTPNVCSVSGSTVTALSMGACTLAANQSGNANYNPAPQVTQSITVNATVPSAPTAITATAGNGQATVSFAPPANNGGSAITSYTVTSAPGGRTATGTTIPLTVTGLTNGTTYAFTVTATNSVGTSVASVESNSVTPNVSISISSGWNLVGNGTEAPIDVVTAFGDPNKVVTVWKWVVSGSAPGVAYPAWAFYTPVQIDGGAAYAASRGYEVLTAINAGEGFWVNARTSFLTALPAGGPVRSPTFTPSPVSPAMGGVHALPRGWSLIATGDSPTPAQFSAAIATFDSTPPAAGSNVYTSLTTLWAWDTAQMSWYFWAPTLVNSGTLSSYLSSKGYLDFSALPTTPMGVLSPTIGFWVNMP